MGLFSKKQAPPFVSAVVAAAGEGNRMEGIDKQRLELGGMPVVARSIACLESCPRVAEIVVVCRGEDIADFYDLVRFFGFKKIISVVKGGELRQDSVFAGICACSESAEYFAIHDGARPLVLPGDIERCIDLAIAVKAAAVGVPLTDTIKICDDGGVVLSTPERSRLWAVQTPQIFAAPLYRQAMEQAIRERRYYTDDCQLVEHAGGRVTILPGAHGNIKITTPEDIAIAEAIISFREEPEQWQR